MGLQGSLLSEEVVLVAPGSAPESAFGSDFGCLGCGQRHDSREHSIRALLISRWRPGDLRRRGTAPLRPSVTPLPPGLFVVFQRS